MSFHEVNFDGLIGPTHNYAGLAAGNLSSKSNAGAVSSPKQAALQGLAKMRTVRDLGLTQGVLPPMQRPDLGLLRRLGFTGDDAAVLESAAKQSPSLLAAAWSASSMWTANAATVSPSPDTADGRLHLTPANLVSHLHRAIETETTTRILRAYFADEHHFAVHDPLPAVMRLADEGAANHVRLAASCAEPGVELFVYGFDPAEPHGCTFHPRQSLEAANALVRLHALDPARTVLARQSPQAINAGVFHNDVISTGNGPVFLHHEHSFTDTPAVIDQLRRALAPAELIAICATRDDFSLEDAVASYIFNSQLLTVPDGSMVLVAPIETRENPRVAAWVDRLIVDPANPVARVLSLDVRESMRNGGGPACLRLRVPMSAAQLAAMHQPALLTDALHDQLVAWVAERYPHKLNTQDLRDHRLARRSLDALDELTRILDLGDVYPFQRV